MEKNDNVELVHEILSNEPFWKVNKKIAWAFGNDAAIFLSDLESKHHYFEDREMLTCNGFFYYKQEDIIDQLNLSPYQQRKVVESLEQAGLIETKMLKDIPPKKLFKVNHVQILSFLTFKDKKTFTSIYNKNRENKNKPFNTKVLKEQVAAPLVTSEQDVSYIETNTYLNFWEHLKEKFPGAKLGTHSKYVKRKGGYSESKSYKDCIKYLKRLERGGFEDFKFDPDFLKRNHIKKSLLFKKWTPREIKLNLKRLALLRIPGTHPFPNKDKIPRGLKGLIYNSVKGTSFFFATAMHPPYIKSQGKSDEQLKNEKDYKTTGKMSFKELQKELDRVDAMWEKANTKFKKGENKNEDW